MEFDEVIKKYGIDIKKLEDEQLSLAKQLEIEDKIDFSLVDNVGAVDNSFIQNKILAAVSVVNNEFEIVDQSYFLDKVRFPYLPGFRSYRELPAIVEAFNKLTYRPDVVFVSGEGISHPRLGIASHLGISIGVPTIGIANSVQDCEIKGEDVYRDGKIVGKVLHVKPESRPLYVSPGNGISIETAYKLAKDYVRLPHKLPEPMHISGKYGRAIKKELGLK